MSEPSGAPTATKAGGEHSGEFETADQGAPITPPVSDDHVAVRNRLSGWCTDRDRLRRAALFVLVFAVVLTTILIRSRAFLHTAYAEDGDFAVNSLSVDRAERWHQLVGNYSRVGFRHPGPAYFYLLAAGQWLFYSVLHLVPGPYNGQMMGVFVMDAWFLAMTSSLVARATKSLSAGLALATAIFAASAPLGAFGHVWFPYLYMPMFALFVISCAVLASGRLLALPSFVISGGFLIHGHVSFLSTVGVSTVLVLAAFCWLQRGRLKEQLGAHRLGVALSLVWVVLFALPMVLQVLLHYPGPWPDYYHYAQQSTPHPLSQTSEFFGWYWRRQSVSRPAYALAFVIECALLLTDRNKPRRNLFAAWFAVCALQCALFYFYVYKGVDKLIASYHYVGFYFLMVPVLLLAAVAAHAAARLRDLHWTVAPLVLAVAALFVINAVGAKQILDVQQSEHPEYVAAAKAIQAMEGRDGRPVALEGRPFLITAAVLEQTHRLDDDVCLGTRSRPDWKLIFDDADLCHNYAGTFSVELFLNKDLGTRQVLWSGPTMSLVPYPAK